MRGAVPVLGMTIAVALGGCGGSSEPSAGHQRGHSQVAGAPIKPQILKSIPTPGPTGKPASPAAIRVIRDWSQALQAGRVKAAARYFSLPSEMINGLDTGGRVAVIRITNLDQAIAVQETLPCGATLISADQRGEYVNALFKLTGRPGLGGDSCGSGVGQTARTNFIISNGRIVEWIRAPDDPGDNSNPGGGSGSGGSNPLV